MENADCIDQNRLQQLKNIGGDKLLTKMVDIFLDPSPRPEGKLSVATAIQVIQQGQENQDFDAIQNAAHFLKSSSGNLGATKMYDDARELETLATEQKTPETWNKIDDLLQSYNHAKQYFEQMKEGFSS